MNKKITLVIVSFLFAISTAFSNNRFFFENDIFSQILEQNKIHKKEFLSSTFTSKIINLSDDNYSVVSGTTTDFFVMPNDGGINGAMRFFANNLESQSDAAVNAQMQTNNIIIGDNGNPADSYIRYTPPTGFTGQDSFSYRYYDGQGAIIPNSTFHVTVTVTADVTSPVITTTSLVSSIDEGESALGSVTADEAVTWSVSGSGVSIDQQGVVTLDAAAVLGNTYTYTVTATDAATNATSNSISVTVNDITPPVITLIGASSIQIQAGTAYTDLGATANDNLDGDITSNLGVVSTVDTAVLGTYIVTYSVTDANSNVADEVVRTVEVIDTTSPVITLIGASSIQIQAGITYTDLGATANDNLDGDLTSSLGVVSTVDTAVLGTYTVTYSVTDANSNVADEVVRTVEVIDTTPPVITLIGDSSIQIQAGITYTDLGATANDNLDGDLTSSLGVVSTVNISVLGVYTVTYSVSDSNSNNAVEVVRTVEVIDTTSPVITLIGASSIQIQAGTAYTDLGATANDNLDGDLTSGLGVVSTVDTAVLGTYTVTYSVTDANSNVADEVVRTVEVIDTTSPVITLIGASSIQIQAGTAYTDLGATANDNLDGDLTSGLGVVSTVDTAVLGTYTVTYSVTDANSNVADEVVRTVEVIDTTSPVITLIGASSIQIQAGTTYTDLGATANDNLDGDLTSGLGVVSTVDTAVLGTYTVTYSVTDANSNVADEVVRTVEVIDTTLPIITLLGSSTQIVEIDTPYIEFGATALDNLDGDLTNIIDIDGNNIDVSIAGSYTVTYNVTDANSNVAIEVIRTVIVMSNQPTAVDDVVANPVAYNSTNNSIDVLNNDVFGFDGPIDKGLTMINGTSSNASANGGAIRVERNNTLDTSDDVIIYSAPTNFNGVDTFRYTITDASGDASTATVTITVSGPVTNVPIAVNDSKTVVVDTVTLLDVLSNDDFGTDLAGSLSLNGVTTSAEGFAISLDPGATGAVSDDTISYTPTGGFTGTDSFSYVITDGNGDTSTALVTITVGAAAPPVGSDKPTAVDDVVVNPVAYNSIDNSIAVLTNDNFGTDGPNAGHALRLLKGRRTSVSSNGGSITLGVNDDILYSAPKNFSGVDTFQYTITDSSGDASTATVTITVTGLNIPIANNDVLSVDVDTETLLNVLANDNFGSDSAGSLSLNGVIVSAEGFAITVDPGATGAITDDTIKYTPTGGFTGIDSFSYIITDGNGDTATATVTITVGTVVPPVNDTPTAVDDVIANPVAYNSTNNSIDVLNNDSFGNDGAIDKGLTMINGTSSNASANGGAIRVERNNTLDTSDDVIIYSAPTNFSGVDTFRYTITDASGDASTATVTITVLGPVTNVPIAVNDSKTVVADTVTLLDVLSNDDFGTDLAGSLSLNGVTTSAEGFAISLDPGATGAISDDTISYTPTGGFTGTDSFSYVITDGNGDTSTALVTITVGAAAPPVGSDKPTAVDDVVVNPVAYNSIDNSIAVLTNDNFGTDGPNAGHALRLLKGRRTSVSSNGGSITLGVNDDILYSAPKNFSGVDTFQYTITDSSGDASTATVTITVTGLNIPIANNDVLSVDVDTETLLNVLANDNFGSDSAGSLSLNGVIVSAEGFAITVDPGATGAITDDTIKYTPTGGFTGIDSFSYIITDGNGDTATATVTITVGTVVPPVNDTPTAVDDVIANPVAYNSTNNSIDVLNNDSFGNDGAIDKGLTMINGTSSNASANGGAIRVERNNTLDTSDDVIIYSAPTNFSGVDTFRYTITDASGDASTATVTITVSGPATDVPTAVGDNLQVIVDTETLLNVLSNDNFGTDLAGTFNLDAFVSTAGFTITIDAGPSGSVLDDTVRYTPTGGFTGTDSFSYTITDSNGDVSTATVTITVVSSQNNGVPTAVDDSYTVDRNSVNNSLNVTANDNYGIDGLNATHPLTLRNGRSSTASANGGKISVSNGVILYTPPTDYNGVDSFIYTITDASGEASTATVTITVVIPKTGTNNNSLFNDKKNEFLVYPNPSNGYIKSTLLSTIRTKANLYLFDITGKVVYNSSIEIDEGINEFDLNLNLKSGIIFLKIVSPELNFGTTKIVIK